MKRPKQPRRSKSGKQSSPAVRFEATIHATRNIQRDDWASYLEVDRVPDRKGGRIKAILSIDDCVRLLDEGFEIRLYRAHPIGPLDKKLILSDKTFEKWLDKQLKGVKDKPMPTPLVITKDK